MGLKQNAFLRQWIYYKKPFSLGKANKFSLLSLTRGFAPIDIGKNRPISTQANIYIFLQSMLNWNIISSIIREFVNSLNCNEKHPGVTYL